MTNENEKNKAADVKDQQTGAQKAQAGQASDKGQKKKKGKDSGGDAIQVAAAGETKVSPSYVPRLAKKYSDEVVPALMKEFGFKNSMQVPRLSKVVINCAVKDAVANPKVLDNTLNEITTIAGQKAVLTRARKAIATFKIRKGNALGVRVTLRRARMFEFLDRLMNVALPRVRDFKGVNAKAFDGRGNFSLGLREQIIFPEIDYDKVDKVRGMTVTIVTTAKKNEHARALLTELGMPYRK